MYVCKICDYYASTNYLIQKHYKTQKHLNNVNSVGLYVCSNCNKEYKYETGLLKHQNECIISFQMNNNNNNIIIDYEKLKLENEKIKFENEKIKMEKEHIKLEKEHIKETYELRLKVKDLENENLQLKIGGNTNITNKSNVEINSNSHNTTNNTTNNVKLSKIDNLNINFHNVIDIETFINNYENEYGLTNEQTETLLYNQENGGIHSCISSLVHYIKDSMLQQYKEKGMDIEQKDVIFPFLLSDKCLRDHFEKNINGHWDKTTSIENIAKIINITERQIFKHHNKYMQLSNAEKKKLVNGILKSSSYAKLSNISDPNLYKDDKKTSLPIESEQIETPTPELETETKSELEQIEKATLELEKEPIKIESKPPTLKVSNKYQEILDML
jgi:hypothetical protein